MGDIEVLPAALKYSRSQQHDGPDESLNTLGSLTAWGKHTKHHVRRKLPTVKAR